MRALTLTVLWLAVLWLAVSACVPMAARTSGPPGDRPGNPAAAVGRSIAWRDPPDCVVVLPAEVAPDLTFGPGRAEEALARHLAGRIDRVIGPGRRAALTRRLGLDPGHPDDRHRLAKAADCGHAAVSRFWGGRVWGLVWAETRAGLDVAILRLRDGTPFWQGRGLAHRGDGALPLSPVSAALAVGLAARAALDDDTAESVLDDAVRAALRDLPDLRDPQAFASRNSSVRPLSSRK